MPLPPPHPMVCLTPATRLVGVAVNEMMADVGVPWATVAATINAAQTKTVFTSCISIRVKYGMYSVGLYTGLVYSER